MTDAVFVYDYREREKPFNTNRLLQYYRVNYNINDANDDAVM